MCGIAGAFAFDRDAKAIDRSVIARLNEAQRRRGPDGEGLWLSPDHRLALGHRRLAIIDIGDAGAQPMWDASRRWIISFNGQIYNYRALRAELEQQGCDFHTNSDTEVLINVIGTWGEAGLAKLRGMYAFALWDCQEQELWLVRDPYGIKPLYIAEAAGTIWFSSQARALAAIAPVDTQREPAALVGFYLWGHVPEPFCWWAGIRMLSAGHVKRIRKDRPPPLAKCYLDIANTYVEAPAEPLKSGELRDILRDSVAHHLVADVPVGVFLSAGIDSNVIAALAAEHSSPLRTVTLAFDEYAGTPQDEAPLAEAAARILRSDHLTVRIGQCEFEGLVDDFLQSMDQPTIDGLNSYLVSRAASQQGLKVVLSGLGGDELFGGYPSFRQIPKVVDWGRMIPLRQPLGRLLQATMRALPLPLIPPKAAGLLSASRNIASAYLLRRALYLESELDALLDESWLNEGLERLSTWQTLTAALSPLTRAQATKHVKIAALESCFYMRNQLLRDADWSSMAHGLEVRLPLVDAALLKQVGPAIASKRPPTKEDLAACAPQLPEEIVLRPKTGFTTPVQNWIAGKVSTSARGLRGWASEVHRLFRSRAQHAWPRAKAA